MKYNKLLIASILVCLLPLLAGCGGGSSYSLTNPIGEISTPNLLALTYSNFDGVKLGERYIVGENEILEFHVWVTTDAGSLTIFVTPEGDDQDIIYQARDIQTSDFTFAIDTPGRYKLWLEGDDHKGSYTIEAIWKEQP